MGLFDFFKRKPAAQEEEPKEKYWSLGTNEAEVVDPTWEQVVVAVKNAMPDESIFATLAYNYSGLQIDSIQVLGDKAAYHDLYYFEALAQNGIKYVKHDIPYDETIKLFEDFYENQRVVGYEGWEKSSY